MKVPNPIKVQRESLGLTQLQLVEKAGVGRTSVFNAEFGLTPNPNPAILKALDLRSPLIYKAYDEFRRATRRAEGSKFLSPEVVEFFERFSERHGGVAFFLRGSLFRPPFELLLEGRSLNSFCKAFCVVHTSFENLINKPMRISKIPNSLIEGFYGAGLSADFVEGFSKFFFDYQASLRREFVLERASNG